MNGLMLWFRCLRSLYDLVRTSFSLYEMDINIKMQEVQVVEVWAFQRFVHVKRVIYGGKARRVMGRDAFKGDADSKVTGGRGLDHGVTLFIWLFTWE